jgi:hypothetical protein
MLNTQTKILLLVFAGFVLVYLLYNSGGSTEGFTNTQNSNNNNIPSQNMNDLKREINQELNEGKIVPAPREQSINYLPQNDYAPPESDWLKSKFEGRNRAAPGEYKRVSYCAGKRGDLGPSDWQAEFDHNNDIIGGSQMGDNDRFLPMDETSDKLAIFKTTGRATCGSNQNCEPEDLFDVDKYLPQEVNDDWFEVMPEPISVKNRHLINITKPIGINTIGTSLRNANYDLRAAPANPKFVVSPWKLNNCSTWRIIIIIIIS